ncbi:MAG: polyribonucleotide nucleotidyltransferase [Acidobacteria bacterium]|nr:polyribonucleotide nucleotidyltransferase [Acidobacteriota bacterium]
MYIKDTTEIGGHPLTIEIGKIARQADGAVVLRYGDTIVFASAVAAKEAREGIDFFPLTVDCRENNYAAGRIPGNYFRREGRPTEKEVLTNRLIDRPLRPLFPEGFNAETQVVANVISADTDNDPDILSITAASAALYLSDIPFHTPIAGVRVGLVDGRYIINPTYDQVRLSQLNLVVAGTEEAIVMVEAVANEVSEAVMVEALILAHQDIKRLCAWQKALGERLNITKREVVAPVLDEEMVKHVEQTYGDALRQALDVRNKTKRQSYEAVDALKKQVVESYPEDQPETREMAGRVFDYLKERFFRDDVLNNRRRPDGRRFTEIRPIEIEVGLLPRVHGSALFTRGETQALVTTTLGTSEDIQYLDNLELGEIRRRFMLNYNFPPYSVGEVGRLGAPARREIGHGALARRALEAVLPPEDSWPYILRIVSDITESNGSSSMASICGGSLSLMDAGVPIQEHVGGVAMGLVKEGNKYAILTDIAGAEDHYGDMDFKVAGTRRGITALQMDIKISGITAQILAEALEQAKEGRMFIIDKMEQAIAAPRSSISPYAPRIFTVTIPVDKIRDVIGPGGKIIRGIVEQTRCKIDVEDDGTIHVASTNQQAADQAIKIIRDLTAEVEVGKVYTGRVSRLTDFGAFVEVLPGIEALLHISEVADHRIRDIRDVLEEGQEIQVKCISNDGQGKIRLSRRALYQDEQERSERPERADRPGGGRRRRSENRPRPRRSEARR